MSKENFTFKFGRIFRSDQKGRKRRERNNKWAVSNAKVLRSVSASANIKGKLNEN